MHRKRNGDSGERNGNSMNEFFDIILGVFLLLIFGLLLISIGCYFLRKNADFANKSVYDEMKSDSDKLMAWFYRRYYGPNNTLPVLKTRKQSCIFMLAVTLAVNALLGCHDLALSC